MGFNDLCDRCMRSGVEVHRTDENGNTVCVECDDEEAQAEVSTLQFDGRYSVIGLEETNQTTGTITYGELGSYYEVTTPHGEYEDFETVAFVCREDLARLFTAAPQLLAELKQAELVIRHAVQEAEGRVKKELVGGWLYHADKVRDAITKATT